MTDTPVALKLFKPFMPVFSKALVGNSLPVILEKLTAAFSIYLLPTISQLLPPPPCLCFHLTICFLLVTSRSLSRLIISS
jgi:hypothetical protein